MPALRTRLAAAFGLWTATTAGPPLAWVAVGPFDSGVSPAHLAVPVALLALGFGVARVALTRVDDPADRFRDGLGLAGPMALSGVPAVGGILVAFVDLTAGAVIALGGVAGFLAAFLVGFFADRVVLARERGDGSVRFSARKPPAPRARRLLAGVGVLGGAVWATLELSEGDLTTAVFPVMLALGQLPPLVRHRRTRSYEVTDAGLVAWSGHLQWANFDGVAVTDDVIELQGTVWPFGTLTWNRDSIANDDAVVAALERHLSRVDPDRERDEPTPLDNFRQAFGS